MIKKALIYLRYYTLTKSIVSYRMLRETLESIFNKQNRRPAGGPDVVYMTGLPRTGSSLMKNYLGDSDRLQIIKFQKTGFPNAWKLSQKTEAIVIDKATHYIRDIAKIYKTYADTVGFCCIVRDPRDIILSLMENHRHLEYPRSEKFWSKWLQAYKGFTDYCERVNPQHSFMLRYEDLVRYPREVKAAFLNFLGLEGVVESSDLQIAFEDDDQDYKLKDKNRIDSSSIEKYRQLQLDNSTGRLLDSLQYYPEVVEFMKKFGYEIDGLNEEIYLFKGVNIFQMTKKEK